MIIVSMRGITVRNVRLLVAGLLIVIGMGALIYGFASHSDTSTHSTPKADTTPPTVQIQLPQSAIELASSSQTLEVSADASDNTSVARVAYLLDGKVVARSIEPPYTVQIYIGALAPGKHTLQAVAYDLAGNSAKSKVFTFTITESRTIAVTDDTSRSIVQSSTNKTRTSSGSTSSSTGSNENNGSSDNGGGVTDPADDLGTRTSGGWWASLPGSMKVCSNSLWQKGPANAPSGAITVPAGDNTSFDFGQTNKTYWFAPGVHTLGSGEFSQITPGANSTYIGAPGAILDGANNNRYAFSGTASNVRIAYLEIRNFGRGNDNNNEGVINHDSGTGWTMEYLNAHNNDGAAVFVGTDNIVRYNCLKDNGQYGFSMYKPQVEGDSAIKNITIFNNEISGNNQDDWEAQISGCGCTGGGKFWDVQGATVKNNYVHDNLSTGLWADTNDIDFLFDSNWIEHNEGEGIWYEISYNATISRNVIKRNAWTSGASNTGSPGPAIYISESGGDGRLASSVSGSSNLNINNNLLEDNFSGVSIFENANRFCNSNGNTSKTYCTPFVSPTIIPSPYDYTYPNPINATHPCYANVTSEPYTTDCRWHAKNIKVFSNQFNFTEANVPCAGTFCGAQALFATGADNISWDPAAYNVTNVQNDVMFNNGNVFYSNTYSGNWKFAKGWGETIGWNVWRSSPFNQDSGSAFSGDSVPPVDNALDADTATLEGSIGQWQAWFSDTIEQTSAEAHSGTQSLRVNINAGGSWGVQLGNYPGFTATSGSKKVSFWAKQGTGSVPSVTLRVKWFDATDTLIQTDNVTIGTLTTSWQEGTANLTAPSATASVYLEILNSSGGAGNTLYLDDFTVADN